MFTNHTTTITLHYSNDTLQELLAMARARPLLIIHVRTDDKTKAERADRVQTESSIEQ